MGTRDSTSALSMLKPSPVDVGRNTIAIARFKHDPILACKDLQGGPAILIFSKTVGIMCAPIPFESERVSVKPGRSPDTSIPTDVEELQRQLKDILEELSDDFPPNSSHMIFCLPQLRNSSRASQQNSLRLIERVGKRINISSQVRWCYDKPLSGRSDNRGQIYGPVIDAAGKSPQAFPKISLGEILHDRPKNLADVKSSSVQLPRDAKQQAPIQRWLQGAKPGKVFRTDGEHSKPPSSQQFSTQSIERPAELNLSSNQERRRFEEPDLTSTYRSSSAMQPREMPERQQGSRDEVTAWVPTYMMFLDTRAQELEKVNRILGQSERTREKPRERINVRGRDAQTMTASMDSPASRLRQIQEEIGRMSSKQRSQDGSIQVEDQEIVKWLQYRAARNAENQRADNKGRPKIDHAIGRGLVKWTPQSGFVRINPKSVEGQDILRDYQSDRNRRKFLYGQTAPATDFMAEAACQLLIRGQNHQEASTRELARLATKFPLITPSSKNTDWRGRDQQDTHQRPAAAIDLDPHPHRSIFRNSHDRNRSASPGRDEISTRYRGTRAAR